MRRAPMEQGECSLNELLADSHADAMWSGGCGCFSCNSGESGVEPLADAEADAELRSVRSSTSWASCASCRVCCPQRKPVIRDGT